jgi:6-phosphogluconolactonase (cycloisomerase 2 family)
MALLTGALTLAGVAPFALGTRTAAADGEDGGAGRVYVLDNKPTAPNSISVFRRNEDGTLRALTVQRIGGVGSVAAFADGTQGSIIGTPDGERLFAVDAGSDQISVIDADEDRLSLTGVFASGGAGPVSLSYRDGLLYVLNAANASAAPANVTGFHVDEDGRLHPIAGSTRPLSAAHPNPAQVQIDPSGRYVLVTEKGTNLIDVYRIGEHGALGPPAFITSTGAVPFAMAFNPERSHEMIVADAAGGPNLTGAATAYRLHDGTLSVINGPVPDHQIAPCWMVITRDGEFAYTSNADSQSISGYGIDEDNGTIHLLNRATGITATTPAGTFPLEEGLSSDSRYLYVLDSRLLDVPPGPATLSGFRVGDEGGLRQIVRPDRFSLPFSAIGLVAF